MKNTFFILISTLFFFLQGFSQEKDLKLYSPSNGEDSLTVLKKDTVLKTGFDLNFSSKDGVVNVVGDSRLNSLTEYLGTPQAGQNAVKMAGYRLQIFYDQEKNNVNQKRADYLARYKGQPAYINYKAPNFRLRIGDFRTRLQAENYMNEIKVDWPDAIIVEDDIELPSLED
jgi:hypothetical protein